MVVRQGRILKSLLITILCTILWCFLVFKNEIFSPLRAVIDRYDSLLINETQKISTDLAAIFNASNDQRNPKCGMGKNLVGPLFVNKDTISWEALRKELPEVKNGGKWSPSDCTPLAKTAIIIPYRDREEHLKVFLRQIHPILQRQQLEYQIFVIEQADKSDFNRGKLMNVGFKESSGFGNFDCFVFHDVDLIPEDDRNYHGCHDSPMHMSVAIDKFLYKLTYHSLFGGIEMFTKLHFEKINGFTNIFWGWGAEDDNLYQRIERHGLQLKRPPIEKARYKMLVHGQAAPNQKRFKVLKESVKYFDEDGLSSLLYEKLDTIQHWLYTKVSVDLKEAEQKIKIPWNETVDGKEP